MHDNYRVTPTLYATGHRFGQVAEVFRFLQQDPANVSENQAAIDSGIHLLAPFGWQMEEKKGIFSRDWCDRFVVRREKRFNNELQHHDNRSRHACCFNISPAINSSGQYIV